MQKVSASRTYKERMKAAKARLPEDVGQLALIQEVVRLEPKVDTLLNWFRWKNAYSLHVADPELTELVEAAAEALLSK